MDGSMVKYGTSGMTIAKKRRTMILGYSSSGTSRDLIKAFQWGYSNGLQMATITSKPMIERIPNLTEVVMECNFYHNSNCYLSKKDRYLHLT